MWLWRLWGRISPAFLTAWTTVGRTIYHPDGIDPLHPRFALDREHEAIHVRQFQKLGCLWFVVLYFLVLPCPLLRWGCWRLEREAYLKVDILRGGELPEAVVESLGGSLYGWPWPRRWMLTWFRKQENV